jgi:hypothetical protein
MAMRKRRRGREGVRGVGVGGDAAADAGARGRRLLQAVDGAVAHRAKPRRRYAGGEQYLINWAKRSKSVFFVWGRFDL